MRLGPCLPLITPRSNGDRWNLQRDIQYLNSSSEAFPESRRDVSPPLSWATGSSKGSPRGTVPPLRSRSSNSFRAVEKRGSRAVTGSVGPFMATEWTKLRSKQGWHGRVGAGQEEGQEQVFGGPTSPLCAAPTSRFQSWDFLSFEEAASPTRLLQGLPNSPVRPLGLHPKFPTSA